MTRAQSRSPPRPLTSGVLGRALGLTKGQGGGVEIASSARDAAYLAAERVRGKFGVTLEIYGKGDINCSGALGPHADALFMLFALGVDLAGPAVRVVLRPDRPWLHVRGQGIPRMGEGLAPAPFRAAVDAQAALEAVGAYLVLDAGGFLVIYAKGGGTDESAKDGGQSA